MLIAIASLVIVLVLGVGFWWLQRISLAQTEKSSKAVADCFERLQRTLLLAQKEFERNYDAKSSTLRSELSEAFQANRKEMQAGLFQTTNLLDQKVQGMDQKLDTRLKGLTDSVGNKLELNLKEGFLHFAKIQEHLKGAEAQLSSLNIVGQSINDLNNLLRLPHLRGGFGEAVLEQLLNDLLPQDGYELQYRIVPSSTERVDAVVKYPNHVLPIDSKFPREQVLPLFETQDPLLLETARKNLTDVIRGMARSIKEKYIHPEHGTTDMALLFVPSETLYFEVCRNVRLSEELAKLKVFIVSPNTLATTLHAITISKNYYDMAKGVEKTIQEVKKAQQHFANFEGRFRDVGTALGKAQNAFGMAGTHLARYSSAVNRLTGGEELDPLPALTKVEPDAPHQLEAPT